MTKYLTPIRSSQMYQDQPRSLYPFSRLWFCPLTQKVWILQTQ